MLRHRRRRVFLRSGHRARKRSNPPDTHVARQHSYARLKYNLWQDWALARCPRNIPFPAYYPAPDNHKTGSSQKSITSTGMDTRVAFVESSARVQC